MMKKIDYQRYFDKVCGCFQGKCIAGTIGAPYEGMKQLLDIQYAPALFENIMPNDDLDLQVLWLEVLEKKGVYFTSDDLADAFLELCPYSPGEYAIFKKNYRRGLHPPVSGWFNNKYYIEGMGCPIRSEIWACLAPGNPQLASELASKDGILDHSGNSVFAEQFLAVLEAEAFFENGIRKLIAIGLEHIPADSRIACLIKDVMCWCDQSDDWKQILKKIIQKYGHPDCTNLFQNIGVTIMALLLGRMNFVETTVWRVCGPYWENNVAIGNLKLGESYIDYIKGDGIDDTIDKIRNYHINTVADFDKEYLDLRQLTEEGTSDQSMFFQDNGFKVNIHEDMFSINDLIGFQGSCVLYMLKELISHEEREVTIQIGHTDVFELWINGRLLSRKTNVDWWTGENVHISGVHLKKGVNRIGLKLARRTEKA
ncbi:MAG: ADP-ribosylglycohydrolase family protein, partial [Clostridiales bacterium]|nr:ADP-ribosylglycohydrolase family protein [Clostridiales bacterium]